jgi:hypothetical protein
VQQQLINHLSSMVGSASIDYVHQWWVQLALTMCVNDRRVQDGQRQTSTAWTKVVLPPMRWERMASSLLPPIVVSLCVSMKNAASLADARERMTFTQWIM